MFFTKFNMFQHSQNKYVPPHRRDNFSGSSNFTRKSGDENQRNRGDRQCNQRAGDEKKTSDMSQNCKRNFFQGSKFNTRSLSSENDSCQDEPGSIEIPEMIIPPVVDPVERKESIAESTKPIDNIEVIGKRTKTSECSIGTKELNPSLRPYEIKLINKLSRIRNNYARKEEKDNFYEWLNHYGTDLEQMYNTCVDRNLPITYNEFVKLAYRCTETEFETKKLKHIRPLI